MHLASVGIGVPGAGQSTACVAVLEWAWEHPKAAIQSAHREAALLHQAPCEGSLDVTTLQQFAGRPLPAVQMLQGEAVCLPPAEEPMTLTHSSRLTSCKTLGDREGTLLPPVTCNSGSSAPYKCAAHRQPYLYCPGCPRTRGSLYQLGVPCTAIEG